MFRIPAFIILLVLACSVCAASDVMPAEEPQDQADLWADNSSGWPDDIAGLTKALYKARLAQLAILVADESQGESSLLLKDGVSTNPDVKAKWREEKWGDIPAISVYQASVPVNAQFEGIDPGRIIGAVAVLVEAASPADKTKTVKPGVYALYMVDVPVEGRARGRDLLLISHEVGDKAGTEDEGKVTFKEALRVPGTVETISYKRSPKKELEVTVVFPKVREVTADKPSNRADTRLRWDKQAFRFDLDLDISPPKQP